MRPLNRQGSSGISSVEDGTRDHQEGGCLLTRGRVSLKLVEKIPTGQVGKGTLGNHDVFAFVHFGGTFEEVPWRDVKRKIP